MKRWRALGGDLGLGGVGLVGAHVVVLQGGQHRLQAGLDLGRVVAGAVAGEQELQHKGGHIGALLDAVQQVLAHDLAVELIEQLLVQCVHRMRPFYRCSPSPAPRVPCRTQSVWWG